MRRSNIRSGVDTSVLMRLLTGAPQSLFERALAYVAETDALNRRLLVSSLVVSEVYFACQHHYGMPKQEVLNGVADLLSKPVFAVDAGVLKLLAQAGMARAAPGFVDRLIHLEYTSEGTGLVSFEKSAARMPQTEVLRG